MTICMVSVQVERPPQPPTTATPLAALTVMFVPPKELPRRLTEDEVAGSAVALVTVTLCVVAPTRLMVTLSTPPTKPDVAVTLICTVQLALPRWMVRTLAGAASSGNVTAVVGPTLALVRLVPRTVLTPPMAASVTGTPAEGLVVTFCCISSDPSAMKAAARRRPSASAARTSPTSDRHEAELDVERAQASRGGPIGHRDVHGDVEDVLGHVRVAARAGRVLG